MKRAELLAVLPEPTGGATTGFAPGYSDSLSVGGDRLFERANYGIRVWRIGSWSAPEVEWDLMRRPGGNPTYTRTGDGQQTVVAIGASPDGKRVLAGWKDTTHGSLLLDAAGNNRGEFMPARAYGGVGVLQTADGRYIGLALSQTGLSAADVTPLLSGAAATTQNSIPRVMVPGAPGGLSGALCTSRDRAVYTTPFGSIVHVKAIDGPGLVKVSVTPAILASCAAREGGDTVVGVEGGLRWLTRAGADVSGEPTVPLPGTPACVAVHQGIAYAWVGDGYSTKLFANGEEVLDLDPSFGPVLVTRAAGGVLYAGTGQRVVAIRGCV